MSEYQYKGRDFRGKRVSGYIQANSENEVANSLEARNITPIQIKKLEKTMNFSDFLTKVFEPKPKPNDILNFYRQMSTLLAAGITVLKALKQLSISTPSKNLRAALEKMANSVESGLSLSSAMSMYPNMFSKIEMGIIEIGENIGKLQEGFEELSKYLENKLLNRKRLLAAVRYPSIVMGACLVAVMILNVFVIPKFSALFSRFHTALPWPTRVLISVSTFLREDWLVILIFLALLVVFIPYLLRIPSIRYIYDRYKLSFPVLGNLQKRILLAQFTWTLGLVLRAGLPTLKGMNLVAESTDNAYLTDKIREIRATLDQGENFTQSMEYSDLFDASVIQLIDVGESSGKLEDILIQISGYYEREIDYDIKRLNDLLEPLLLVFVGGMVLILALGIYLPMWDTVKFAGV